METKENTHFLDKVADALRKAAVELEEFQVMATLGKADAKDIYEDAKKKFNSFLHDSKSKAEKGKEKMSEINVMLEELRVQLALGKAETRDAFEEQKKKILKAIHDLENKIKSNETFKKVYAFVLIELEKFKLQLEVLEKRFEKGKVEANEAFEKGKKEFNDFVERMKNKYSKESDTSKWGNFQSEMTEAFTHFKKAFTQV